MSNDNHVKTFIGQIQDEHQKAVEKPLGLGLRVTTTIACKSLHSVARLS